MRSYYIIFISILYALALSQGCHSADIGVRQKAVQHSNFHQPNDLGVYNGTQYSGFLSVDNDKELFFWFFESANDPKNDPVILWLNGGPGCSSISTGALFEHGPSKLDKDLNPVPNPYTWVNNASMIFLDQPVNTGFSHTKSGRQTVNTTAEAAKDVYKFVQLFFDEFKEYNNGDFHVFGESYSGHFIPAIGVEFLENSASTVANISSVGMGNPLIDYRKQAPSYYNYTMLSGDVTFNDVQKAYGLLGPCEEANKKCEESGFDQHLCVHAKDKCENISSIYYDTGMNTYDVRKECVGDLCYESSGRGKKFVDKKHVRNQLGVSPDAKFEDCSSKVSDGFDSTPDYNIPYSSNVTSLLDSDIPVLVYVGDQDFICNWVGQYQWVNAMEYKHKKEFHDAKMQRFNSTGVPKGTIQHYDKLTLLKVWQAGHMVPLDQPEAALTMANRWLSGNYELKE